MPEPTFEITFQPQPDGRYLIAAHFRAPQHDDRAVATTPSAFDALALRQASDNPSAYGRALTDQVFADPAIRAFWGKCRAVALQHGPFAVRLRLGPSDAALHALRWETLRDPEDDQPLALSQRIRLARTLDGQDLTPIAPTPRPAALSSLVMVAAPNNLDDYDLAEVDADGEVGRARAALGSIAPTVLGDVADAAGRATLEELIKALEAGPTIVVLVAHGRLYDGDKPALYLEDAAGITAPIDGFDFITEIGRLTSRPRLLVLVSCKSVGDNYQTFAAIGPLLAQQGIPAVIAFQGNIAMAATKKLLPRLLEAVQTDGQVDRALAAARAALGSGGPWWQPVLFLRGDGRLWAEEPPRDPRLANREQTLRALLHDHSGFIASRLEAFVGRETELAAIRQRIAEKLPTGGYVTITGQAGQGKSSIIARLLQDYGPATTAHHFIPLKPGPDHQVGLLRNLMAQLILKYDLTEIYVASDSRPALRDYLPQVLHEIAAKGGQELIIIDGLDQIEEDVSGERDLSFLPLEPPPGIVFVLGTRPNDALKPLELRKPRVEYWLPDLSPADFALILAHRGVTGLDAALTERFYAAMHANALYLDLVAQELAQAEALAPEAIIARVADNPDNLFSLAMERLRRDRQRWRTVIKPILGLLLAAREPLSGRAIRSLIAVDDDECRDGLQRLGGLIQRDGRGRYYLYHLKLIDFLRQDVTKPQKEYIFASDEEEGQQQILADWCAGGAGGLATIWQDATGEGLEQEWRAYAREHYIAHLAAARSYTQLWEVVDAGDYGRAKLRHDPSGRSYVLDLDMVRDAVIAAGGTDFERNIALLPRLYRYSLLRGSISSQADNIPNDMFPLMVRFEREQEAINLAELLTDPIRKAFVLIQIAVELKQQPARQSMSTQLFARAQAILSDLCRNEPQQVASIFLQASDSLGNAIIKFVLRGDPDVIQTAYDAIRCLPDEEGLFDNIDACLKGIRIAMIIAQALIETGRFQEVFAEIAMNASQDTLIARLLSKRVILAAVLLHTPHMARVLTLIRSIKRVDVKATLLAGTAQLYISTNHNDWAEQLFNEAIETLQKATLQAYQSQGRVWIVSGLIATERFDEALTIARSIEEAHSRALALESIAQSLAEAQRFDEAFTIARSIDEAYRRALALQSIAQRLAEAHHVTAIAVFDEALTTARSIEEAHRRALALQSIAQSLAKAQRFNEARTTARTIEEVRSRALALQSIAQHLAEAQRFDEAFTIAHTIDEAYRRALALQSIAQRLAEAQRFDTALTIAHTIENTYIRASVLQSIAQRLAEAHQATAIAVFDEALTTARTIIQEALNRAYILGSIAQHLAEAQRFDEALTTARTIEEAHRRAYTLESIAQHLAEAQRFDEALTTVRSIEEAHSRALALQSIAQRLAEAQRFDEALTTARSIEEAHSRTLALQSIAQRLAEAQRFDEALTIARSIEEAHSRALALQSIAQRLAEAHHATAIAVFDEALTTARSIEEAHSRALALQSIAQRLAEAHQATAIAVFDEALTTVRSIEEAHSRALALQSIAQHLTEAQRFDEALTTVRSIEEAHSRTLALQSIAQRLAEAQRFDEALTIARSIEEAHSRALALQSIAQRLAEAHHVTAIAVFDEALTTARSIEEAHSRALALQSIAQRLAEAQRFDTALTIAHTIEEAYRRALALQSIAQRLAEAQRFDTALTIAHTIEDSNQQMGALLSIAKHIALQSQAQLWALVQRSWREAQTYDTIMELTPLSQSLFASRPELALQLVAEMDWVKRFLAA